MTKLDMIGESIEDKKIMKGIKENFIRTRELNAKREAQAKRDKIKTFFAKRADFLFKLFNIAIAVFISFPRIKFKTKRPFLGTSNTVLAVALASIFKSPF